MSKLSGWFGRSKKKSRQNSPTWQDENGAIYELIEHPHRPTRATENLPQYVDNESQYSENYQMISPYPAPKLLLSCKTQLNENTSTDGFTYIPTNRTVPPTPLSVIKPVEQTGRRMSSGRASVLVPLSQTGQASDQRKVSRLLVVNEVQPRNLLLQEDPETRFSLSGPKNVNQTRPSATYQGVDPGRRQVRLSVVGPVEANEYTNTGRMSMSKPPDGMEGFPLNPTHQPVVYAVMRKNNKPPNQQLKKLVAGKRKAEEQEAEDRGIEGNQREQLVYDAHTPTRGRTNSVLQQSVRTLASKKDETSASRKNIRYSVDMDVFSTDVKRRSGKPVPSGYVNMEKGQGMYVSDFLNPITSIFVTDLKNPVPKDPLRKPRENNNWVRPRQNSMRQVVTPKHPNPSRQVKVLAPVQVPSSKPQSAARQTQQNSLYESDDDDDESSDSDESTPSYHSRSKYSRQPVHHRVYAAAVPRMILPDVEKDKEKNEDLDPTLEALGTTEPSPSPSKHSIKSEAEEEEIKLLQPSYVGRLSSAQKTDIADTLDFLCNPPPDIMKDAALVVGSGSKVRWRMEIKKGDNTESHNENKL